MKTAQSVAQKFTERASNASSDYVSGAESTTKDQSAIAIASKEIYKQALTASFARDSYSKGLSKSGKAGWLNGVRKTGSERFASGVLNSAGKYATNSAPFDGARNAAENMPRGMKGSDTNLARVKTVVSALRTAKVGQSA